MGRVSCLLLTRCVCVSSCLVHCGGGVRLNRGFGLQIEFHPHVLKESIPLLEFHEKHAIVTESYGGQSPIFRSKGTSLDPVLSSIAERLSKSSGKTVQEGHVLMQWQKAKGIVFVTYVHFPVSCLVSWKYKG